MPQPLTPIVGPPERAARFAASRCFRAFARFGPLTMIVTPTSDVVKRESKSFEVAAPAECPDSGGRGLCGRRSDRTDQTHGHACDL